MNNSNISKLLLSLVSICALTACVGDLFQPKEDPTLFYILKAKVDSSKIVKLKTPLEVNFLPISIPAYMQRVQIVTLDSANRVYLSEYDRWSELPAAAIVRVLSEDISRTCKGIDLYVYPTVATEKNAPSLKITITEFIGTLGDKLEIRGKWRLVSIDGSKIIASKMFSKDIPCGNSYDSYVEAMNTALMEIANDISYTLSKSDSQKFETPTENPKPTLQKNTK